MSWADRLDCLISGTSARTVRMPWDDSVHSLRSDHDRIRALQILRHHVKNTPSCNVNLLIGELADSLQCEPVVSSDHPLDLKMNWDQVKTLESDSLFTIGGHSHTHPILSFLEEKDLDTEISMSVKLMREQAGIAPDHYSYPEGMANCFNDRVIEKLKGHGVKCCPTAIAGTNSPETDPFHLRRILVING
jgi:hypothetical protein